MAVALLAALAGAAFAQTAPAAAPPPVRSQEAGTLRVIEDDQVRIEEVRIRGQLARITVAPKAGAGASPMRAYEINVGAPGRDPSQDRSAAGQRVWPVLRW